ncbi:MAG: hypothetical protein ACPG8W_22040 [Candidatus Promineifilaceae bacterium]
MASLTSQLSNIRSGFYATFNIPTPDYYLVDVDDDGFVIVEMETYIEGDGWNREYFRVKYSADTETITFAERDAWEAVERQTEWVANRREGEGELVKVTLTTNSTTVTEETVQRRKFAVVNVNIAKHVMNGRYFPSQTWAAGVETFNGRCLVKRHPLDMAGDGRTANTVDVPKFGFIYNALNTSPLPTADLYFDEELCTNDAEMAKVLSKARAGEPVEISTGMYSQLVANSGVHNGEPYSHVAVAFEADHIAVLPDEIGACSANDGCGI